MMQQLVFTGPRSVEWIDAPEPAVAAHGAAIVGPLVVSTCDMVLGRGARASAAESPGSPALG